MTPDISASRIYTDFQGLADLRRAAKDDSGQALDEVAKQFEAIFIQMMLKSMRDASLSDGIFDSDQSKMYQGMFDKQISLDLSSKGVFGIANMLVKQLSNNRAAQPNAAADSAAALPGANPIHAERKVESAKLKDVPPEFRSARDFVEFMRPQAEQAANRLGVKPEVLIAQAALETGWGQKIIKRPDGSSTYNLFAIKADKRWPGEDATVTTLEYRDGVMSREPASFRAYDSFQQSFDDYVDFIKQGSRYEQALSHDGNARHYIQSLQTAGYATDPGYAEKVIDIMDREIG